MVRSHVCNCTRDRRKKLTKASATPKPAFTPRQTSTGRDQCMCAWNRELGKVWLPVRTNLGLHGQYATPSYFSGKEGIAAPERWTLHYGSRRTHHSRPCGPAQRPSVVSVPSAGRSIHGTRPSEETTVRARLSAGTPQESRAGVTLDGMVILPRCHAQ